MPKFVVRPTVESGKADAFVSKKLLRRVIIYFRNQSLRAIGAARDGSSKPQRIYLYNPMKNCHVLQAEQVKII